MTKRIASIDFHEESSPKSAVIHFEKVPAAKTALMVSSLCSITKWPTDAFQTQLNGGTLNDAHLTVTSDTLESDEDEPQVHTPRASLDQTDKPRAASACVLVVVTRCGLD